MIKIYPTEVEAVDSTGTKIFTLYRCENEDYQILVDAKFSKESMIKLFDDIRAAVEVMETEIEK